MPLFPTDITAAAAAAATPVAPVIIPGTWDRTAAAARNRALSTTTDLVVPGMVRPYLPHQAAAHEAAMAAIAHYGYAVLADDMGLGKTQVMLGLAAEHLTQGGYVIMIAPPVTKAGYMGDLAAAFPHLRFAHLHGRKADFANLPIADVYWLTDDAPTMKAWLTRTETRTVKGKDEKVLVANAFTLGAKFLTRDEMHRDKGSQGKATTGRAQVMMAVGAALRAQGTPIVGATGTLLTNRMVEAFVPLQVIGGERLILDITPGASTASAFLWSYCNPQRKYIPSLGRTVTVFDSSVEKAGQLNRLMTETVYVRREKSDLGNALPHSGWVIKPIALNGVLDRYDRLAQDFLAEVRDAEGPEAMWRKAKMEAAQRMFALWQEAGVAKAAATVEYVKDLTDQGRKVVCFYHHTATLTKLVEGFAKAGVGYEMIIGGQNADERMAGMARFQDMDSTSMVMLAQIGAAGIGVTLTAAADAVFVQVPWSAGDLKQAADRILRTDAITYERARQGGTVTWHVIQAAYADGTPTFDMAMWGILERKAQICDAVNAGRPVTMDTDSIMHDALQAWFPQASSRY